MQPAMVRQPAPHVQAAVAAAAQPRIGGPPPRPVPAAHVRAAIAPPAPIQAKPAVPPPARPAPHVVRAVAAVQAKPSGLPPTPGVLQPAKRRAEKKLEDEYGELRKSKRRKKQVDYGEVERKLDRRLERIEQKDIEEAEEKRQAKLKLYEQQLAKKRKLKKGGKRRISYIKSQEDPIKVDSFPISKERMQVAYAESQVKDLESTFFYVSAPTLKSTFEQHFVIRQGHDYVLFPLTPDKKENYAQEGNVGPTFEELAANAEAAVEWLRKKPAYKKTTAARGRVARDINRLAGGREPRVQYPLEYLAGAAGLTTFAAVIRADKGRVSKATKYIESVLKQDRESFSKRYGGDTPIYVGTGKQGGGSGPERLRKKAKEDPGSDSEYSSSDDESS